MVHFWDRKTTKLLRSLRVREECTSPASVAWNNANRDQLMFASGGDDGTMKVWTAPWNGNKGSGQQVSPSINSQSRASSIISVVCERVYIGYFVVEVTFHASGGRTIGRYMHVRVEHSIERRYV